MTLDPELLEILACPSCHARVDEVVSDGVTTGLHCTGCGLLYPVRDGIPVLLVDDAVPAASSPVDDDQGSTEQEA